MVTENELEAVIYENAADLAIKFLADDRKDDPELPPGLIEEAVRREIVYIGKITAIFEAALRDLIPYAFDPREFAVEAKTSAIPVLEGVVVEEEEESSALVAE